MVVGRITILEQEGTASLSADDAMGVVALLNLSHRLFARRSLLETQYFFTPQGRG